MFCVPSYSVVEVNMQQYAGLWEVKEPVVNSEAWLKLTLAGPSLNPVSATPEWLKALI